MVKVAEAGDSFGDARGPRRAFGFTKSAVGRGIGAGAGGVDEGEALMC